jgi:hypothetical protein
VPGDVAESGYSDEETDRLQLIGGDGFLSPGGSAEVARILGARLGAHALRVRPALQHKAMPGRI